MGEKLTGLIAGIVFGIGLSIAGMVNPAKVVSFLDFFGNWDPSLAFVMGGAVAVYAIGYQLIMKRAKPLFAEGFQVPSRRDIDARLITGAVLFGAGWGLAGYCPGPAITGLAFGMNETVTFFASMAAGVVIFKLTLGNKPKTSAA
jgi:uncharacterized membrane protein YedE/YeeE